MNFFSKTLIPGKLTKKSKWTVDETTSSVSLNYYLIIIMAA